MSFFHFILVIFTLYIILFKSLVCHYLITYKNLILFSFPYVITDFVLCINICATFLPNFVSIKAVFVDFFFFAFYIFVLNFWKWVYIFLTIELRYLLYCNSSCLMQAEKHWCNVCKRKNIDKMLSVRRKGKLIFGNFQKDKFSFLHFLYLCIT